MPKPPSPLVEMLWEAGDPHRELEARFGFSDAPSVGRWVSGIVAELWGIRTNSCDRILISDRNALAWLTTPDGPLVAKWSIAPDRFSRLRQIAQLTDWLNGQGLPVSTPIPARDGRLQIEVNRVSIGLQHHIPGELLDVTDADQVRAAGAVLARLHDALATYPDADCVQGPPDSFAPFRPLAARVANWVAAAEHLTAATRDFLYARLVDTPPDPLPIQLGHWDYRSANLLCSGTEIAAILDFEQLRRDHRIVELARSATMLGTRYRNWGPVPPEVHSQFLAGYQSVHRLTPAEARWWDLLLLWQTLIVVSPDDDPTGWWQSAQNQLDRLASTERT